MKLLFCLFNYFPYGGLQRDCMLLAKACLAAGDEVDIITQSWTGPKVPGITVHCIPVRGWANYQKCNNFTQYVLTFIKKNHYDGVIGFDKMPGLDIYYAAGAYRSKAQGLLSFLPRDRTYEYLQQSVFSSLQKTHILLLTKTQQDIFIHHYATATARFHMLPPGIDPNRRLAVPRAKKTLLDQKNILFIGSSFKNKGLERALRAVASLPKEVRTITKLWIVGHDSLMPYWFLIKQLGLSKQIKFIGASDDVPQLLQHADILLHPAHLELTGTVLLEALVAGVPVLTTAACGFADYVKASGAGKVIQDPFSQAALNQALQEMLSPDELHHLQEKALDFSKTADVYRMPEVAVELIHEILTNIAS